MPPTLRLLLLLMFGLFGLQPVGYAYDAPVAFVSGAQNIVAASSETGAPTGESAAPVPLNFSRTRAAWDNSESIGQFPNFVAADNAPILFRGTTVGFPGNPGLQQLGYTPTSTDPAIATIFATESSNFGSGIVHVASSEGLPIVEQNVLGSRELEVVVGMSPSAFADAATSSISAAQARAILQSMGISLPDQISGKAQIDALINSTPKMTPSQITQFTKAATAQ